MFTKTQTPRKEKRAYHISGALVLNFCGGEIIISFLFFLSREPSSSSLFHTSLKNKTKAFSFASTSPSLSYLLAFSKGADIHVDCFFSVKMVRTSHHPSHPSFSDTENPIIIVLKIALFSSTYYHRYCCININKNDYRERGVKKKMDTFQNHDGDDPF